MANVGSKGIVRYEETFATDSIDGGTAGGGAGSAANGIAWIGSADTGDTAFVRVVAAGKGLHVAGALTNVNADRLEFMSDQLLFTGQEGHSSVELLLQLSSIANVAFFFGFNDAATGPNNIIPVKLDATTFTQNAADGCLGILFDTNADNDELHCFWGNAATKTTTAIADLRMNGMAPTASKWLYMKGEMQDLGSTSGKVRATFLAVDHNGRSVEKVFNTSVDRDLPMNLYLGVENRSTTARSVYIKCPAWQQTIADM